MCSSACWPLQSSTQKPCCGVHFIASAIEAHRVPGPKQFWSVICAVASTVGVPRGPIRPWAQKGVKAPDDERGHLPTRWLLHIRETSQPCAGAGRSNSTAGTLTTLRYMRTKLSARCLLAAAAALLVLLPACLARSVPVSSASIVSTPQQLKAAVEGGAEHIVIRKHLDLRELRAQNTQATEPFGSSQPAYFTRFASLRSIVVRYRLVCAGWSS